MKHLIASLLLCLSLGASLCLQAQLIDDFSDGDFTANPAWSGNTANFIVNSVPALQLSTTGSGQSSLYTTFATTSLNNKEWRFRVEQSFAGSDANQSRIYFAYTGTALSYSGAGSAGVTGYFLRLGEGGSTDVIRLYKDTGTGTTLVASGTTSIAAAFTMNIRITRDALGNWSVSADPTGGDNFTQELTANDATYSDCNAFGVVCTYTTSNADNFVFDNIYFGTPIVDTAPPTVVSLTVVAPNALDVLFNETVTLGTAQALANYNVAGIGIPSTATRDAVNSALVHLTFTTDFPANVEQTISISGVSDNAGNVLSNYSGNFTRIVSATANYRDIVFNEILADPDPAVGLPNVEFLELHNNSTSSFDLNGWTLVNTTTPKILGSYFLPAGGYVVLCDASNVALFSPLTNVLGIDAFSALSNAGDSLTLVSPEGITIDYVSYTDDWFATSAKRDGGWTLELINASLPCYSANNWAESEDVDGGTPGAANSIANNTADTTAPLLVQAQVSDAQTLVLTFNETMDPLSFQSEDVGIEPAIAISAFVWNSDRSQLTITLAAPVAEEVYYTITISGIQDCSGNAMSTAVQTFVQGRLPAPGDIIINEILCDPNPSQGLPIAEYIEVYNRTDHLLELTGIQLNSGVFAEQVVLEPDSFLIITDEDNTAAFISYNRVAYMASFPGLTDAGTTLTLKNNSGAVLDEVSYTSTWYRDNAKDDGGWSLELINPLDPCSDATNWRASVAAIGGTPGAVNSVLDTTEDTTPPQVLFVFPEPQESVTLLFNEPLSSDFFDLVWTVNGTPISTATATLNNANPAELILYFGQMQSGVLYNFTLSGVKDCWGNEATEISNRFALPEALAAGNILINEVLSNPYDGGRDFLEIYNNSTKNLSLKGCTLADGIVGLANTPDTIATRELMLYPGEYLVLTKNDGTLQQLYPNTRTERVWDVPGLADFSSTTEVVFLFGPNILVLDQLQFDADMQFPLLESSDGVSLERIAFNRPSSDRTNWHSASETSGFATPGFENSQSFNAGLSEDEFNVDREVFSPDNDGNQDVTTFSYKLDAPGYVGNLRIFDSEGRQVRYLMRNELLGREGGISWDGFTDDKQKCAIGIYVVYFEVFNTEGTTRKAKRTCVLAHSLE